MAATARRPTGLTLLALALFFLFVSAIGNLLVWRSIQPTAFPPGSPAIGAIRALTGPLFSSLVSLYGVTALVAAIAAWRMLPWMSIAFVIWSVAALLLGTFFLEAIPSSLIMGGRFSAITFVVGLAAILWLIYRYLQRIAPNATNAGP
jgi:hypothetical protein